MSVNIKDKRAHELIKQLAAATGETMTAAIRCAVEERLERVQRDTAPARVERILAIGRSTATACATKGAPASTLTYSTTSAASARDR